MGWPRSETRWDSAPCGVTSYVAQQPSHLPAAPAAPRLHHSCQKAGQTPKEWCEEPQSSVSHRQIYFYRWWWNILWLPGGSCREVRVHTGTACKQEGLNSVPPHFLLWLHGVALSSLRLTFAVILLDVVKGFYLHDNNSRVGAQRGQM